MDNRMYFYKKLLKTMQYNTIIYLLALCALTSCGSQTRETLDIARLNSKSGGVDLKNFKTYPTYEGFQIDDERILRYDNLSVDNFAMVLNAYGTVDELDLTFFKQDLDKVVKHLTKKLGEPGDTSDSYYSSSPDDYMEWSNDSIEYRLSKNTEDSNPPSLRIRFTNQNIDDLY